MAVGGGRPYRQPVTTAVRGLRRGVLNVVDCVLLEVRMIEQVEGFRLELQANSLAYLENPRHAQIKILYAWPAK